MKRIFKYRLELVPDQTITMVAGAHILTLQVQGKDACMWALCPAIAERTEQRRFRIVATGEPIEEFRGSYIGTFQPTPILVFHVFEVMPA